MTGRPPNDEERRAAEVVNRYVTEQENRKVTDEEFARMNARERLNYARQWDQSTMPAWRDRRSG